MKVSEIFRSIQGEGKNQGRPCTFLRLSGCNLNCAWCDTPYARSGGDECSYLEILERVKGSGGRLLCITGGEPLLQGNELRCLLMELKGSGWSIEIETNGTIDFRPYQEFASICMDVKCPSSGESSDQTLLSYLAGNDSVKFVVSGISDCLFAKEVISANHIGCEIFFSPVYGTDYHAICEFLLSHDLPVRLQLQLHKVIGVR